MRATNSWADDAAGTLAEAETASREALEVCDRALSDKRIHPGRRLALLRLRRSALHTLAEIESLSPIVGHIRTLAGAGLN